MSLLILGGTGTLGRQIVKKALNEGFQVKCLVRNFRKAFFLKEWGAELVYGDLKIPETIPLALYGVTAIIDASTARPSDSYYSRQIDLYSKYILVEAAKKANIKRYVFFSLLNAHLYTDIPLMQWKLLIENTLIQSNINYTIFNLSGFFQGLITQYALPILDKQSIWMTGESASLAYLNTEDIAKIAIKSLSFTNSQKRILPLVGSTSWTSLDIIKLCEKISGQKARITQVPISILKLMRYITSYFQWTWNISSRLAFSEILFNGENFSTSMEDVFQLFKINHHEFESLESYLQDYFKKVMKKLKEVNYQVLNENKNIDNINF